MILRKKFDHALVKHAIDFGATFFEGKSATDIKISKDKARIFLQNGTKIESKIVVGCDGVWSTIAKKSGLLEGRKNIGMCVYKEYSLDKNTMDRYFGEKRICHIHMKPQGLVGYGWVFPKMKNVNIGIGQIQSSTIQTNPKLNLKRIFEDYIDLLKEKKIIPTELTIHRAKGGAVPISPLEKTYSDRIVLCGDAAGLINPISGEGIYYAMASGEIAADVISKSLAVENTSERFLSSYQNIWQNDFGRDLKLLSQTNKQWTKGPKRIVRLASMDEKLGNLAFSILQGEISISEYRWKLISRYLYVYLKDIFNKSFHKNQ
jgi:digeranylgeranylglycerophospholipid reductase